jgi:hypothetical protein
MTDLISDLSVKVEGLRQVQNYQPWAQTFEEALVEKKKGIEEEHAQWRKSSYPVAKALGGPNQMKIAELGRPYVTPESKVRCACKTERDFANA